jgi:hypothetical protein
MAGVTNDIYDKINLILARLGQLSPATTTPTAPTSAASNQTVITDIGGASGQAAGPQYAFIPLLTVLPSNNPTQGQPYTQDGLVVDVGGQLWRYNGTAYQWQLVAVPSEAQIANAEWLTSVAGTNTVTASTVNSYSALVAGFLARFIPANTNSGAVTLNVNGIGASAVTKNGTGALVGGELVATRVYLLLWDGTEWQIVGIIGAISAAVLSSDSHGVPTAAALPTGDIWQGNGSNLPAAVAVPASATVLGTSAGSALQAAALASGDVWIGNGSNLPVPTAIGSAIASTGSFTPVLTFSGSNTGLAYTASGSYILLVNGVYLVQISISLSAIGTASGNATVTGLPHVVSAGYSASVANCGGMVLTGAPVVAPDYGQTFLILAQSGASGYSQLTAVNFSNASSLNLGIIYS